MLCQLEPGRANPFKSLLRKLEPRLLGISEDHLAFSKHDVGIVHNAFSPAGFPVPGWLFRQGCGSTERGKLLNVLGRPDGQISFRCAPINASTSAVLQQEDFDVAMALAFSSADGPIWPDFSLDTLRDKPFTPPLACEFKHWNPSWLSETELGRTLYATDYWAGAMIDKGRAVFESPYSSMNPYAAWLLDTLKSIGNPSGPSVRIFLHPSKVMWEWYQQEDGSLSCSLSRVEMAISAVDQIVGPNGETIDGNKGPNDLNTAGGRKARFLTEHYDMIAQLWPAFERARQLMGLIYSINRLREYGYVPNEATLNRVQQTLERFTMPTPSDDSTD